MNTSAMRALIVAALVVVGLVVVANGFSGRTPLSTGGQVIASPTQAAPSTHTKSPKPTSTLSPDAPGKITYVVYNGTSATGLAATWDQKLSKGGLQPADQPQDSPVKPIKKTIVYYAGGAGAAQNQADARYVADTFFKGAKVAELAAAYKSVVPQDAKVAVVLGEDVASQ